MRQRVHKLMWYVNRFRKMPPMEIPYRIVHKVRAMADRKRSFTCARYDTPFSKCIFDVSGHVRETDVWEKSAVMARADRYLCHRFTLFGIPVDFGDRIDWHMDPKTGNRWPLEFWADVDHRNSNVTGGVKFVWEINRLDFLPTLGIAYYLTGDCRYADEIMAVIRHWLEENPYPMGVNWVSGIELGLRIANLVWALSFLSSYAFTSQDYQLLNRFAEWHGRHLYRYPSKYSSNNNHALAEALGLFLIGICFPHFSHAATWRDFGKKVLEREVMRQILPDGGSFEYTTTYLSFAVDFFLLFKIVCHRCNIAYDGAIDDRLKLSAAFIYALSDENGNLPNIGDQDSAVVVNFGLDNWENFQSVLNTAAVLYDKPEWAGKHFPDIKTRLLLDRSQWEAWIDRFPGRPDVSPNGCQYHLFHESGLAIIRDQYETGSLHFVGNATPLGMPPLYAHGHLDALSFWLSLDGLEVFVDPGTYIYHGGQDWRRYFRATNAHNTICINGIDFSRQIADFMFDRPYEILENSLAETPGGAVWTASHDAYHQLNPSVAHRRKVVYDRNAGTIEIADSLRSQGRYTIEQFFHCHPDCRIEIADHQVHIRRAHLSIRMDMDGVLSINGRRGSEHPVSGWFSRSFNHIAATDTIVAQCEATGDITLRTIIYLKSIAG